MNLTEVKPPYDTEDITCDENNPNIYNVDFWCIWLQSVDYVLFSFSRTLYAAEDLEVTIGHRGVRIGEKSELTSSWYYEIKMGYKDIKTT